MAWIPMVIGAISSIYSAQQKKKEAAKVGAQQDRLYGVQAGTAEALQPFATSFYQSAQDAYNPALAYYKSIASGDRGKVLGALAQPLSLIGDKYRMIGNASRELSPRGGQSAAYNTDLAYRAGDEQQNLINNERVGAYANLVKLAGLGGDLGAGAAGLSTNAAAGAGGMLNNAWALQQGASGGTGSAYGDLGKALMGMFGQDKSTGNWYLGNNPGRG